MPKADKKQRQKHKREAKRKSIRRSNSVSPLRRVANAPGPVDCWMSDSFEQIGQAQMYAFKRAGGLSAIACFLIDRGVVGLKDAWTRVNIERREFDDVIEEANLHGSSPMKRITVEEAQRFVAGAARWAFVNGMRLPREWLKTAAIIGGVGDWMTADVSRFISKFAGHPEDLRQRLIGEPFETYVERTDVQFVFSTSAPYMNQNTGKYHQVVTPDGPVLDDDEEDEEDEDFLAKLPKEQYEALLESLLPAATELAGETKSYFIKRGMAASSELVSAWQSVMLTHMLARIALPDAPEEDVNLFTGQFLNELANGIDADRGEEYDRAVGQVSDHLESNPEVMMRGFKQSNVPPPLQDGENTPA